jgi:aromatic-amino-acid transaminase
MSASIFAAVEMAPRDPILGLNEAFNADTRADQGQPRRRRLLRRQRQDPAARRRAAAEKARLEGMPPRGYQPIEGPPPTTARGAEPAVRQGLRAARHGRVVTIQALGGTGALKVGADYLKRLLPGAKVYISDPSWENHRALFEVRRLPGRELPLLRCRHPRRELRRHEGQA